MNTLEDFLLCKKVEEGFRKDEGAHSWPLCLVISASQHFSHWYQNKKIFHSPTPITDDTPPYLSKILCWPLCKDSTDHWRNQHTTFSVRASWALPHELESTVFFMIMSRRVAQGWSCGSCGSPWSIPQWTLCIPSLIQSENTHSFSSKPLLIFLLPLFQ